MHNASFLGSISLGRWNGLPIRLHFSCLLVAVFVFFFRTRTGGNPLEDTGLILLVWLVCVLLHEIGHCLAVNRIGGTNEVLVLTPFGGLSFHSFLQQPGRDLWVAIAGPLLSLTGFTVAGGLLLGLEDNPFLNPFNAEGLFLTEAPLINALRLTVWINLGLVLFNLIPIIPFDGGWVLHALLWPAWGDRRAWMIVRRTSLATALALGILAIWLGEAAIGGFPLWVPLMVTAAYCFCFSSVPLIPLSTPPHDGLPLDGGLEVEAGSDAVAEPLEHNAIDSSYGWPSQKQLASSPEEEEECLIDEILQRVHDRGLASLTRTQQKALQRAARRYRSRTPE